MTASAGIPVTAGGAANAAMGAATSPAKTTAPAVMVVLLRTNGDVTDEPL